MGHIRIQPKPTENTHQAAIAGGADGYVALDAVVRGELEGPATADRQGTRLSVRGCGTGVGCPRPPFGARGADELAAVTAVVAAPDQRERPAADAAGRSRRVVLPPTPELPQPHALAALLGHPRAATVRRPAPQPLDPCVWLAAHRARSSRGRVSTLTSVQTAGLLPRGRTARTGGAELDPMTEVSMTSGCGAAVLSSMRTKFSTTGP
eukprot:SAG31_NODE_704_length_12701_cov_17.271306_2_plen_208_part_00